MNTHVKVLSSEAFFRQNAAKWRSAVGLRPNPLRELTALPRPRGGATVLKVGGQILRAMRAENFYDPNVLASGDKILLR